MQPQEEEGGGDEEEGGGEREEEWVEYQDSLGRTRRCLKEDLPHMKELDRQMATDGRAERWEGGREGGREGREKG